MRSPTPPTGNPDSILNDRQESAPAPTASLQPSPNKLTDPRHEHRGEGPPWPPQTVWAYPSRIQVSSSASISEGSVRMTSLCHRLADTRSTR